MLQEEELTENIDYQCPRSFQSADSRKQILNNLLTIFLAFMTL